MRKTVKRKNGMMTTVLAAALMVGAVTGGFYALTQSAAAAENSKIITLPTIYPAITNVSTERDQKSEDSAKYNFTIVDNDLEYYKDKKPTANDISRQDAAGIGVQALTEVFGLDLSGKTIVMAYNPAFNHEIQGPVRAEWTGEYWSDGKIGPNHPCYIFTVDAITGKVDSVQFTRVLDVKVDLSYDSALAKNPAAMENVAKKYAEELNVVGGKVKSSTIGAQGYAGNDPDVNFRIVGENGQLALIGLSRHDNALLSISYHDAVLEMDAATKHIERKMAEMEKNPRASGDATTEYFVEDKS